MIDPTALIEAASKAGPVVTLAVVCLILALKPIRQGAARAAGAAWRAAKGSELDHVCADDRKALRDAIAATEAQMASLKLDLDQRFKAEREQRDEDRADFRELSKLVTEGNNMLQRLLGAFEEHTKNHRGN